MSQNSQVNFPTKGISGKLYVFITIAAMVLLFGVAQFFLAPNVEVISNTINKMSGWIIEYGVRLGFVAAIALVRAYFVFTHVLDTPLGQLKSKFDKPRNDSHSIVLLGLVVEALLLITMVKATAFDQYVYFILTRGAIGEIVGTLTTLVISRIFGVRSMDGFRDEVEKPDNDSFTILVVGAKLVTFALALAS